MRDALRQLDEAEREATGLRAPLDGGREALDRLLPLVYRELRELAHRQRHRHGADAVEGTTSLVHEAYLKLRGWGNPRWRDRAHFFALASTAMRHILIDRARARRSAKRGWDLRHATTDDDSVAAKEDADILLELDEALTHLATLDVRLARVVECRFFGGLTESETGEALGVTLRTVQRDWVKAKALLGRALGVQPQR